jgi:hypothetical protein
MYDSFNGTVSLQIQKSEVEVQLKYISSSCHAQGKLNMLLLGQGENISYLLSLLGYEQRSDEVQIKRMENEYVRKKGMG